MKSVLIVVCGLLMCGAAEAKGRRAFSTCGPNGCQSFASVIPEAVYEKPGPAIEVSLIAASGESKKSNDWLIKHPTVLKLVELTNSHRFAMGVGPVILDEQMCVDAQRHAQWMATQGGFQHSGMPYMEIIHQSVGDPGSAVNGWIASPPHHGIMLSGSRVGFGYAISPQGYPYWVGVFR